MPGNRRPVDIERLADRIDSATRPQLEAALQSLERRHVVALDRALRLQGATVLNPHRKERQHA